MIAEKKIVVVLPAYFAARTLERTVAEIPRDIVDEVLLVDDASADATAEIGRRLNLKVFVHGRNCVWQHARWRRKPRAT